MNRSPAVRPRRTPTPSGAAAAEVQIRKPWGEEIILERRPGAVTKLLRLRPHHRLSLQYHRRKSETLLLLSGAVELTLGRDRSRLRRRIMKPGDSAAIPSGLIHRLSALQQGADVLETASTDDDDDIVRLADDYGRT